MENTANIQQTNKIKWAYSALVTLIIWFALVLQFSITIANYIADGRSAVEALELLFSFYTILTNLMMVICLSIILIAPKSSMGRFFQKNTVLTAITLYITVVAVIYNTLLRNLVELKGLAVLANELLHVINPILFILYWLFFAPKIGLNYKQIFLWLWYPAVYFVYALVRGAITGIYPYPFLNAAKFGYGHVALYAVILLPLMWALGALYIYIAKKLNSRAPGHIS